MNKRKIFSGALSALTCIFMLGMTAVMPAGAAGETLSLSSVQGKPGEKVTVNVDITCNNNFESMDIVVEWDDKALKAAQAQPVGKAMGASDAQDGYCTVVIYGSEAIADGTVATIDFTIPADAPEGKVYDLKIGTVNTFAIYEGPDIFNTVKTQGGTITVGEGGNNANAAANNNNNSNNGNNGQTATEAVTTAVSDTAAVTSSSTEQTTAEVTTASEIAEMTEKNSKKPYKKSGTDALGALAMAEIIAAVILIYAGLGIALGFLTKNMNEKKGYKGGFLWGLLLTVIGVVIVAVRKPKDTADAQSEKNEDKADGESDKK